MSQVPSTSISDTADHLRRQVGIVSDLFEQRQHDLNKLEQEWIRNAIQFSTQILSTYSAQCEELRNDRKVHRRLQSLHTFTSNDRKSQSQEVMWNSQFLIMMQNLNSVMNMLSWSIHNGSSKQQTANLITSSGTPDVSSGELSRFLNRRRFTASGNPQAGPQRINNLRNDVENTIAELRATNSLLRTTHGSLGARHATEVLSSELPLSLVETVELWRQNAEDALKAAMLRYFEQEELLQEEMEHEKAIQKTLETNVDPEAAQVVPESSASTRSRHETTGAELTSVTHSTTPSFQTIAIRSPSASNTLRRKPVGGSSRSVNKSIVSPTTPPAATAMAAARNQDCPVPPTTSPFIHQPNLSPSSRGTYEPRTTSLRLAPSNGVTDPISAPLLSPFISNHGNARTSAVSLISTDSPDLRATSIDLHSDSAISVTSPFTTDTDDIPDWQQPEAKSGMTSPRKSRGRVWLERQAGFGGD